MKTKKDANQPYINYGHIRKYVYNIHEHDKMSCLSKLPEVFYEE